MIASIGSRMTQDVFDGVGSRYSRRFPHHLLPKARRLLDQINAAPTLDFLAIPPGNRLEKLSGDLKEHWSIRINDQWRIVFCWQGNDAHGVEIRDYH